jgi:hypothetical protein
VRRWLEESGLISVCETAWSSTAYRGVRASAVVEAQL